MNHIRRYRVVDPALRARAVQQAQDLIAQGWSRSAAARSIAPAFGVHANTVSNWLREAGDAEPTGTVDALRAQVGRLSRELDSMRALVRKLTDPSGTGGPDREPE